MSAADQERRKRWLGIALRVLWLALFLAFHGWNFAHYNPLSGYDGKDHLRVLQSYHETGHAPVWGYAASNPPLYYAVAGAVWGLTASVKAVQALSLALFCCNVWIVKRMLWVATRNPVLRWAALSFIAYLPVHITYAYMVFNYSLAHAEALATVYCLYSFARRPRKCLLGAAGVLTSLGIFTALINLYLIPLAAFTALFFGPRKLARRLLWTFTFLLGVGVALAPYYFHARIAQGCFFCTSHRIVATQPASALYPRAFYTDAKLSGLSEPYFHHTDNSLWNLLYETAFGDYFGYLVPERLTDSAPSHTGLISSGRHFLDPQRQRQLAWLNFLALPVAFALLAAFVHACGKSVAWLPRALRSKPPISLLFLVAAGLVFAQFFTYIHRYTSPNHVNVHAGYVLLLFLLGPVELVTMLKSRLPRVLVEVAFFSYAAAAYWVFLLR